MVVTVAVVWLYQTVLLAMTAGKLLGFGTAFDRWRGPVSRSAIIIGGMIPADIYTTPRSRFTVVFVHGVNKTGKDSPDVRLAAEAFAGSGFRVVVPDFARLRRQNVTPEDIDDVVSAFRSAGADGGIVCASYGCGPALIAATRPEIRDRVRFVAAFGAYFDLTNALRFIVTSPTSPLAYSKWVYMSGNADLVDVEDRQALLAIAGERQHRPPEEWTLSGEGLGPPARAMLRLFESQTAAEFDSRLSAVPALKDRIERLSPSRYFGEMRARLIVIHMSSDPCIPSSEGRRMAEAAKARGIPYSLTVLSIHGHTKPEWPKFGLRSLIGDYLPESRKFMRALRETLSYAS